MEPSILCGKEEPSFKLSRIVVKDRGCQNTLREYTSLVRAKPEFQAKLFNVFELILLDEK